MKTLILNIAFLFVTAFSVGQTTGFDSLTNDILLRINTYETDSITKAFLTKHVPLLAEKPKQNSGWTAYPPTFDTTPIYTVEHSITFPKHPFINFGTKEFKLIFLTNEKENKFYSYKTYFLTFLFDNRQEALNAFDLFCNAYDKLCESNKKFKKNGKLVAFYKSYSDKGFSNQVQFILTQDELYNKKYKIIFGQIIDLDLEDFYGS